MIGRMLFVGLNTNDLKVIEKLIVRCHVGGVILYTKNYQNYNDMINLINYIHKLAQEQDYTILIGIDEEGYRVNRLPKEINNLKSPYAFHNNIDNIKEHGSIIAEILAKSNINVNFAPVLDIKRFPDNHAIGDRCFGDDAKTVIKNTIPYIKEFEKKSVIPVVKHFPGHGATKTNSHYFIPVIWKTKKLFKEDILPFKEAINNNIDVIMVGHFLIPKFSFFTPTSISRKTVFYLRNKLNFKKVIITDDIFMGPLRLFNKANLIKKAINSGVNIVMIKYYDGFFKDFAKLEKSENKLEKKINNSLNLINYLIEKYHISNSLVEANLNIDNINKQIKELNKKTN